MSDKLQYFPTHARFTPWLIGVGLGYLLHTTKKSKLRLSPVTVTLGWLLSAGLMLTSLLLAHRFQQPEHSYDRLFESLYTCLMRPAWSLGLAWVIFACTLGYGGFIKNFLSWRFFQVLGRLTYTIYLIHMTTMIYVSSTTRTAGYFSERTLIMHFISEFIFSFAAAFVLSMVFESPAIVIEKAFMGKLATRKKPLGITKSTKVEELSRNDDSKLNFAQITSVAA